MISFSKIFINRSVYIRSRTKTHYIELTPMKQVVGLILLILLMIWIGYIIGFSDNPSAYRLNSDPIRLQKLQKKYNTLLKQQHFTQEWFQKIINILETEQNDLHKILKKHTQLSQNVYEKKKQITQHMFKTYYDILLISAQDYAVVHFESRFPKTIDDKDDNENFSPMMDTIFPQINDLIRNKDALFIMFEENISQKIAKAQAIIHTINLVQPDEFMVRMIKETPAIGGPFIPLKDSTYPPETVHDKQLKRAYSHLQTLALLNISLAHLPLTRPLYGYNTTSHFGSRTDPINRSAAFHSGLDFGAPSNTPVHATLSGKVVMAKTYGPYGRIVEIDHGNGLKTRYAHLKKIKVKYGQNVDFFDVIGTVGSTGRSTGSHLHYEVWYYSKVLNPLNFIISGQHLFNRLQKGS